MRRPLMVLATLTGLLLLAAPPAGAHPLGNATVNHYDGLTLSQDRLVDDAVSDIAEIPTYQRKSRIDSSGDGRLSSAEMAAYATSQCAAMARTVRVAVGDTPVALAVRSARYTERPGAISLTAGRLSCRLEGAVRLDRRSTLRFENLWDDDGIGWHEITATGTDVSLQQSPFPRTSLSDELRRYPGDLLSSPLDVRRGTVTVVPGGGSSTYELAKDLPVAGPAVRALDGLAQQFNAVVGRDHLTLGVGLLAVLLSMLLGAGHAFLPGHGKTIMAAYLVGRRGRLRDVVTVGATVTVTHTAGVLVLGLILTTTSAFAPTAAEQLLGIVSGVIVAGVGLGLLVGAVRSRRTPRLAAALAEAPARELVSVGHGHGHPHPQPHDHDHDHDHSHPHSHGPAKGFGRSGLVGLGIAGGLVPSPSALLVLLAATALGRTVFGVVLVLGYGLGMALALCAAGLLLVRLRSRLDRFAGHPRLARADRLLAALPVLTALLVVTVGVGLALRAAGGSV